MMEQNEQVSIDDEASYGDNGTVNKSSFHLHVGYILTKEEVDMLNKKKPIFKWEMPAIGMPMSKWVGTREHVLKEVASDQVDGLKPKLYNHWLDNFKTSGSEDLNLSRQRYFSLCNSYQDILHCNKRPFYQKGKGEDSSVMDAYIMHALNHIYHTRDLVTKNDATLTKHRESKNEEILHGGSFLDQGFTRPKVMFLLPFGSMALRVVKRLIQLTPLTNKGNVEHIERFLEEFGAGDDEEGGV